MVCKKLGNIAFFEEENLENIFNRIRSVLRKTILEDFEIEYVNFSNNKVQAIVKFYVYC